DKCENASIASAIACVLRVGTNQPSLVSVINSGTPPQFVLSTGKPIAMASTTTFGTPSSKLGINNKEASAINLKTSSWVFLFSKNTQSCISKSAIKNCSSSS